MSNKKPHDEDFPTIDTGFNSKFGGIEKCYHKHPPLKLPGTDLVIYGGSCSQPVVKDADLYIGFQTGMAIQPNHYPWNGKASILYPVVDMAAPQDAASFDTLLEFTKQCLGNGMKVHCGCIGGHGRTGTFLAALVSKYGEQDAVNYVRDNYCHKAAESSEQINFLHDHYGIVKAKGSKTSVYSTGGGNVFKSNSVGVKTAKNPAAGFGFHDEPKVFSGPSGASPMTYKPVKSGKSIWL